MVEEGSLVSEALGATWGCPRAVQKTPGAPGASVHREEQPSGTVDKGGQGLHKGRVRLPIVPARERRIGLVTVTLNRNGHQPVDPRPVTPADEATAQIFTDWATHAPPEPGLTR